MAMESLLAGVAGLVLGLVFGFLIVRARSGSGSVELQSELVRNDLANVRESLGRLGELVQRGAGDDKAGFAELSTVLRHVDVRTDTMASALGNSRVRGQWGERAAEDILRNAGFVEGASYFKQQLLSDGSRPDFTFPLPKGYTLNMDVKFPIENYARLIEAPGDADRTSFEKAFARDVRERVKEVATRSYADPAQGTVDYALLFIPSESVYAEINRLDPLFVDAALSQRVIPCSPVTLFGVLAVVRKAVESFAFQQASDEVLVAMNRFDGEWRRFSDSFATLGKQLATVRGTYDQLAGVRTTKLEMPLAAIDAMRRERGLLKVNELDSIGLSASLQSIWNETTVSDDSGEPIVDEPGRRLEAPGDGHDATLGPRAEEETEGC